MTKKRQFREGGYDPALGRQHVEELGGFSEHDARHIDSQATDRIRRRILTAWFGPHGGQWAWDRYRLRCRERERRRKGEGHGNPMVGRAAS
jgi:hypothetical protein